ncbi:hypothetical protein EG68_11430 [Paragonimus skrjabini miyazakii]|uniref:Uncharacterized protein n=1 Tax=Paragonimus skrjabini miyazakii TaxID=59628 RepID=A0A8S9YJ63_9TREM|nr:hypothetical protein EG68_11430 [Paragonimus skrjabini miyazakii]
MSLTQLLNGRSSNDHVRNRTELESQVANSCIIVKRLYKPRGWPAGVYKLCVVLQGHFNQFDQSVKLMQKTEKTSMCVIFAFPFSLPQTNLYQTSLDQNKNHTNLSGLRLWIIHEASDTHFYHKALRISFRIFKEDEGLALK